MNKFICIWWNGGAMRGRWQECQSGTRERAEADVADIERMGYRARVVETEDLRHGLPVGFPGDSASDWNLECGFYVRNVTK
jgi:hypothetical protein